MKIQARETNYGTRVDYILVTKGLLPWISHGDIQPTLKGSDHCPIYIDLREEITLDSGETVTLRDAMKQSPSLREPPRIAAKFWDEFSGKQTVLSAFFGKPATSKQREDTPSRLTRTPAAPQATQSQGTGTPQPSDISCVIATATIPPAQSEPVSEVVAEHKKKLNPPRATRAPQPSTNKRKPSNSASASSSKKRKQQVKGQGSIASFFSKPAAGSSQRPPSHEIIEIEDLTEAETSTVGEIASNSAIAATSEADQLDADYRLACALASAEETAPSSSPSSSQPHSQNQTKTAWSTLFAPIPPPNCTVHDEPTRLYTVNKQGPNKGKTFYLCSRPVGPGYDKGKRERLRDEVDHRYRCNYFKWASEVRREAMREKERERT